MHLAGADGVLIIAVLHTGSCKVLLTQCRSHHEVVGESTLGPHGEEFVHGLEDAVMPAVEEPLQALLIHVVRLTTEQVRGVTGLMLA